MPPQFLPDTCLLADSHPYYVLLQRECPPRTQPPQRPRPPRVRPRPRPTPRPAALPALTHTAARIARRDAKAVQR